MVPLKWFKILKSTRIELWRTFASGKLNFLSRVNQISLMKVPFSFVPGRFLRWVGMFVKHLTLWGEVFNLGKRYLFINFRNIFFVYFYVSCSSPYSSNKDVIRRENLKRQKKFVNFAIFMKIWEVYVHVRAEPFVTALIHFIQ